MVDVDEQNIQAPHIEKALYTVVSRKRALADDPAVLVGIFWESIDHPKMVPGSLSGMEAEVDEVGDCTPSSSDDGIHALEMQSEASQRSLTMNEAEHADAVSRAGVELEPESNEVAIPKASDIDPARPHPVSKTADTWRISKGGMDGIFRACSFIPFLPYGFQNRLLCGKYDHTLL